MGYFTSLYASELPHRAVAVYMYLKDRADKDGKCYPAIKNNRRGAEAVPPAPSSRAIADLINCGRIRKEQRWRENGGKSSCMYYVQ